MFYPSFIHTHNNAFCGTALVMERLSTASQCDFQAEGRLSVNNELHFSKDITVYASLAPATILRFFYSELPTVFGFKRLSSIDFGT